jgi:hypothetical protein
MRLECRDITKKKRERERERVLYMDGVLARGTKAGRGKMRFKKQAHR